VTPDELNTVVIGALTRVAPELDAQQIRVDVALRDQVDLDSMDFLNFVVALHDRLGVDIPEVDYATLSSVSAIVRYLATKLGTGTTTP
jgi:acyl carrier protein